MALAPCRRLKSSEPQEAPPTVRHARLHVRHAADEVAFSAFIPVYVINFTGSPIAGPILCLGEVRLATSLTNGVLHVDRRGRGMQGDGPPHFGEGNGPGAGCSKRVHPSGCWDHFV